MTPEQVSNYWENATDAILRAWRLFSYAAAFVVKGTSEISCCFFRLLSPFEVKTL